MKTALRKKNLRILIILLLAAVLIWIGTLLYGELQFYLQEPSAAAVKVHAYAMEHGLRYSAYPQELIALLERNPETEQFVLEYPLKKDQHQTLDPAPYANMDAVPLFLQWDSRWGYLYYGDNIAGLTGCGPLCLSMAAFYLTGDEEYAPDKMLSFAADNGYYAKGYGSSWTLISEGGPQLGLEVKELPLVKSKIFHNLEAGNPVICVMGPGDFTTTGHFIVMTGCEDGLIRVNDPNSIANSEKLWRFEDIQDQIRNLWAISK